MLVIKVGGSIQDDVAQLQRVMDDVVWAATSAGRDGRAGSGGLSPVVVHGGGKAISAAMKDAGLQPRFVKGQRYTDEATIAIVERCLCGSGSVNEQIVAMVDRAAGAAVAREGTRFVRGVALHALGACVLHARRVAPEGSPDDLGLVGWVSRVNTQVILGCASVGVPVIAPVALDAERPGGKLNINADLAAGAIAEALGPACHGFVLVSDTPGIRDDRGTFLATISRAEIERLIGVGAIDGGMLPKVQACVMALDAGIGRTAGKAGGGGAGGGGGVGGGVCVVDGRQAGALRAVLEDAEAACRAGLGTRLVG